MNNIIDGKKVSEKEKENLKQDILENNLSPSLAVIQVGDNKASNVYVRNKKRACEYVGIKFSELKFPENIEEYILIDEIKKLNNNDDIDGIIVQLPLPSNLDAKKIVNYIDPLKDVDGLTYENVGNLVVGNDCLVSCTPSGVMRLLDEYNVDVSGKNVCIVGRSALVGIPLMHLMLNKDATVTVCHSKTSDLKEHTLKADILVAAVGKPNLITEDMVKDGAVVIDVGINKVDDHLCGDVDFKNVSKKAGLITPVPGGVGPMTVLGLLSNVVKTYKKKRKR
ncbi:MAG: bifunctional methylenetetrahydrofolate dehydrogenase/methenyltetrahydrofolate cyclohydrolase FolD [Bacilli bacterium]|nr:bifunctional methylenetetrahydrofolate dehydrogenase/methenyltetrahydrofolate cyclohydrolase FolD [Bacilli bacterium]